MSYTIRNPRSINAAAAALAAAGVTDPGIVRLAQSSPTVAAAVAEHAGTTAQAAAAAAGADVPPRRFAAAPDPHPGDDPALIAPLTAHETRVNVDPDGPWLPDGHAELLEGGGYCAHSGCGEAYPGTDQHGIYWDSELGAWAMMHGPDHDAVWTLPGAAAQTTTTETRGAPAA